MVESETGRIRLAGVNLVLASGLSSAHAEVVALSLAQTGHGSWDLVAPGGPDLELVANRRTCLMCYGAAMWSGVRLLLIAGHGPEVEELTGFDEGLEVVPGVLLAYVERPDVVVYNARGRGSIRTSS